MVEVATVNWIYVILLFILGFITYYRKSLDLFGSAVMIIMGIVLFFDWMNKITSYLLALFGGWYGF